MGSHASRTVTSLGPTCESANSWPLTRSDKATFGEYLDGEFMSYALSHLVRAQAYADHNKTSLVREDPFGYGMDGTVWRTTRHSAVKVFEHEKNYDDELECYQRFADAGVEDLSGFKIPSLLGFHDKLRVIELKIVRPPFLLDFGKVYLDAPPPYWDDAEIMGHWHAEGRENFGERWSKVMSLIGMLQKYGIWYVDPKTGNIMFGD